MDHYLLALRELAQPLDITVEYASVAVSSLGVHRYTLCARHVTLPGAHALTFLEAGNYLNGYKAGVLSRAGLSN